MELESKIEGLLFYKGEDMKIAKLSEIFNASIEEINEALNRLEQSLSNRGLVLMRKDDSVFLSIHKELSSIIESIRKDEIAKDLSKAALETLSIILYKNGISRSEIDYIRGVNSSFIIRNLLVRGLVEKIADEKDTRRVGYRPTFDTLSYMGIVSIKDLPNYESVVAELEKTINQKEENHD